MDEVFGRDTVVFSALSAAWVSAVFLEGSFIVWRAG
jgi:hypothetical protein